MALSKIGTNSLEDLSVTSGKVANDGIGPTQLDETASYAFTGTVTGAGESNVPAFHASLSSNQSVAGSTHTVLQFNTELFDTDSAFDTSNYKFTPQVAGKYFFGVKTLHQGAGLDIVYVKKNGSLNAEFQYNGNDITTRSQFVSTIIEANGSTDYFEASVYHNAGSNKDYYSGVNNCQFFGFLVST